MLLKWIKKNSTSKVIRIGAIAALITFVLTGLSVYLAPGESTATRYQNLCRWDCVHYFGIIQDGYRSKIPPSMKVFNESNFGFFPGFPISGRIVHRVTGMTPSVAAVATSQFYCFIFWIFFLLILDLWQVGSLFVFISVVTVLSQPGAFYLVVGYSESTFLSAMMAMIYFTMSGKPILSGIGGFLTSATRIVGIPVAMFPIVFQFTNTRMRLKGFKNLKWDRSDQVFIKPLLSSFLGACGGLGFFLYSWIRYGDPALYMHTQREGWGIIPNYLATFQRFTGSYFAFYDQAANVSLAIALAVFGCAELIAAKKFQSQGLRIRLPLYFCIFIMDFISNAGVSSHYFMSMIRYVFPSSALLVLCFAHLSREIPAPPRRFQFALLMLWFIAVEALFWKVELPHWKDYVNYNWFA